MPRRASRLLDRSEAAFAAWGAYVVRRRWRVLIVSLAATAALAGALPGMTTDNSAESFLRPGDPARRLYDAFQEQFGQDELIVVGIRTDDLFDPAFLAKLRSFHEDLVAEVPYVSDVTSMLNARHTRGEGDTLVVEDLMEDWPETAADRRRLRERILETPLYLNTLVDASLSMTTVTLEPFVYSTLGPRAGELTGFEDAGAGRGSPEPLSDAEAREMVDALRAVMERYESPDFRAVATGGDIPHLHSTDLLVRDVNVLMSGAVLAQAALLFFCFRRISGVVLPLVAVLGSLIATLGIMVCLGIPASNSNQIVPTLLLTVGVCSAVHILTLFYQRLAAGGTREEAVVFALGHSGLAVLMACLTTAAGLLSFTATELQQLVNLGIVAPIGVMMTFVYTVATLPAMLAVVPLRARTRRGVELQRALGAALARGGDFAARRPWWVIGATLAILAAAVPGAARLQFSQYPLRWFPERDPVRQAAELLDRQLRGAGSLEVVIDTGRENGLHDPAVLQRIEEATRFAESLGDGTLYVGKTISILDIVKETHKALNENRRSHYAIPGDRQLLAQELLLFENSGSDDLEDVTDSLFRVARVTLRLPWVDGMLFASFIGRLEAGVAGILGPDVGFYVTGLGSIFSRTFAVVNVSMARSYALALLIITPMMVFLIGDLKRGLLAMIPNLVPIYLALALMGWLGIPLDNSSLLVGCIIIGLAVDDTIHFMHRFQRHLARGADAREAVQRTLETTGSAMLFTSLALAAGFTVVTFAYMVNVREFGILACFATVVAFAADVLLAPALMVLVSAREDAIRAARWPTPGPAS
jgi:predicted RND superfamily exporter protein